MKNKTNEVTTEKFGRSEYFIFSLLFVFLLLSFAFMFVKSTNRELAKSNQEVVYITGFADKLRLLLDSNPDYDINNIVNDKSYFFAVPTKTSLHFLKKTLVNGPIKGGFTDLFFTKDNDNIVLQSINYPEKFCESLKKSLDRKGKYFIFYTGDKNEKSYDLMMSKNNQYQILINGKPLSHNQFKCNDENNKISIIFK